jgi:hypothetical protein
MGDRRGERFKVLVDGGELRGAFLNALVQFRV